MRLLSRVAYFCRAWLSCPSLVSIISIVIFACSEEPRKRRDSYGGGGGGGDDGGGVQDGGHHHQHHHASTSHHHHHAVPVTTITMPVTMLFPCIATITTNKYEYCMNVYLTIHLWCFNLNVHTMYLYIYIDIYIYIYISLRLLPSLLYILGFQVSFFFRFVFQVSTSLVWKCYGARYEFEVIVLNSLMRERESSVLRSQIRHVRVENFLEVPSFTNAPLPIYCSIINN